MLGVALALGVEPTNMGALWGAMPPARVFEVLITEKEV